MHFGFKMFYRKFFQIYYHFLFVSFIYIKLSAELITYAFAVFMKDISFKERHTTSSALNNKLKVFYFTEPELAEKEMGVTGYSGPQNRT